MNKTRFRRYSFLVIVGVLIGCNVHSNAQTVKTGKIYNQITRQYAVVSSPEKGHQYEGDIVIPKTISYKGKTKQVSAIKETAFRNAKGLVSLSVPEGVSRIQGNSFMGCENLKSISLPNTLNSIGYYAFAACTNLSDISIPSSVEKISAYSFLGCKSLRSLTIPSAVRVIESTTFKGCSSLSSLTMPASIERIERDAFLACTSLESLELPKNLKEIGEKSFFHTGLSTIDLPEGVERIGAEVLSSCPNLQSVRLSSTLKEIGKDAFVECPKLDKVYSYIDNPNQIEKEIAVEKGNYKNIKLLVPQGTLKAYKESAQWKNFPNIFEQHIVVRKEVEGEGSLDVLGVDNLDFVAFETRLEVKANPKAGYILEAITANGEPIKDKSFVVSKNTVVRAIFKEDGNALSVTQVDNDKLALYPNPASNYVIVKGVAQGETVSIYSLEGELLLSAEVTVEGELRMDVSSLEDGLYVVRTSKGTGKLEIKH